jgi:hypothetical protein
MKNFIQMKRGSAMRLIALVRSTLVALVLLSISLASNAQFSLSVSFAPPELPVYQQPQCPGDGYMWAPGYWGYDPDYGYYWVPGTWVLPPQEGLLWTPAYWGWDGNNYVFYDGYWGQNVGYYGGVNYGYGYGGSGFQGGRWQGNQFYYNTSVSNVSHSGIHNTYNVRVSNNSGNRVSYNGGSGGLSARPTAQQQTYSHQTHTAPVAAQKQQAESARTNPVERASVNHGTPGVAATPKPGAFTGTGVVHAKATGTPYNPPAAKPAENKSVAANPHPEEKAAAPAPEKSAAKPEEKSAPVESRPAESRPAETRPAPQPERQQPVLQDIAPRQEAAPQQEERAPGARPSESRPPQAEQMQRAPAPEQAPRQEAQPQQQHSQPAEQQQRSQPAQQQQHAQPAEQHAQPADQPKHI